MTRLEQTEVCQDCGRPYLIFQVHNCPGPRRLALTPVTQMAAVVSHTTAAAIPAESTGRNQQ